MESREILILVQNIIAFIIMLSADNIIPYIKPAKKGFFCHDQSINKVRNGTFITHTITLAVLSCVILLLIIVVDVYNYVIFPTKNRRKFEEDEVKICNIKIKYWMVRITVKAFFSAFGYISSRVVQKVMKVSFSVLSPFFLQTCQPDYSKLNCSTGFITTYVCTGPEHHVNDARMSFPSGHTTTAVFGTTFIGIYIHYLVKRKHVMLKSIVMTLVICYTSYITASLINTHLHHSTDVLGGFILGMLFAMHTIFTLLDVPSEAEQLHSKETQLEREKGRDSETVSNEHLKLLNDS